VNPVRDDDIFIAMLSYTPKLYMTGRFSIPPPRKLNPVMQAEAMPQRLKIVIVALWFGISRTRRIVLNRLQ
jgi:hypothetical protein